jgi:hypothetical protein
MRSKKLREVRRCVENTNATFRCWNTAIEGSDKCWVHTARDLMRLNFKQYQVKIEHAKESVVK